MIDRFCIAIVRVLVLYKKNKLGNKDGALSAARPQIWSGTQVIDLQMRRVVSTLPTFHILYQSL